MESQISTDGDSLDMGDDGTGHCVGCGCEMGAFTDGCPVCAAVFMTIMGWV